jgi:hypothetical protein
MLGMDMVEVGLEGKDYPYQLDLLALASRFYRECG